MDYRPDPDCRWCWAVPIALAVAFVLTTSIGLFLAIAVAAAVTVAFFGLALVVMLAWVVGNALADMTSDAIDYFGKRGAAGTRAWLPWEGSASVRGNGGGGGPYAA